MSTALFHFYRHHLTTFTFTQLWDSNEYTSWDCVISIRCWDQEWWLTLAGRMTRWSRRWPSPRLFGLSLPGFYTSSKSFAALFIHPCIWCCWGWDGLYITTCYPMQLEQWSSLPFSSSFVWSMVGTNLDLLADLSCQRQWRGVSIILSSIFCGVLIHWS